MPVNSLADGFDWPYIIFVGRAWLCYTEKEVWGLTPRKFKSQLDVYIDIKKQMYGGKSARSPVTGFIDQLEGW